MNKLLLLITIIPAVATAQTNKSVPTPIDPMQKPYQAFEKCLNNFENTSVNLKEKQLIQNCYKQFEQDVQEISPKAHISAANAERYSGILSQYLTLLNTIYLNRSKDTMQTPQLEELINEIEFAYYQVTRHHASIFSALINPNLTLEEFKNASGDDLELEKATLVLSELSNRFASLVFLKLADPKFNKE